ncbi:MAG: restriction endonuclease subunit S [Methylococcales bacterium]|jgi:type I restriction enzyme, S subunit|nr:restriction endonuclease subunit S [Methylococcales bacterium]MBT7442965.1 restriction endonuclease subunit S [Methylococcales bacterium]
MAVDSKYPKSVKAGKPLLEQLPPGWEQFSLDYYLELTPRKAKIEHHIEYDLVTVKRSRGGVTRREHLLGKNISVKSQFFLEEGDFLISKRQIVHGACGIVPEELAGSIVSNEYSVFRAKPNFFLPYLRYLSETLYFQQTCFHSSIGVHIEKMIFKLDSWFKWKFNIPPLLEQKKIAQILSTWDKAIATTEQLLANSQQQKKALMQQLLTGKKRFPGFEGEWKEVKIKEIFTLSSGDSKPHDTEKNLEPNKSIPVFGGNNIMGYSSKSNSNDTVILIGRVGEYCGVTRLVQHECWITDNALYTKSFDNNSDKQFITYLLQQYDLSKLRNKGGQPLISQKPIYNLKIMIPQKTEQKRIASSLTYTDKEIKLLEKQLANLKQEKKALMQQLLTGKRRVEI